MIGTLFLALSAHAATVKVPHDYATLAAALADAEDGWVIEVDGDVYKGEVGPLSVQHDVTIRGTSGPSPALPPLTAFSVSLTLDRVTLSGQHVSVDDTSSVPVVEVVDGTFALQMSGGRLDAKDVVLAATWTHGVDLGGTTATFDGLVATGFASIPVVATGGVVTIDDGVFEGNRSSAIQVSLGVLHVTNSTFSDATAGEGAAIRLYQATATVADSDFTGLAASTHGGAIHVFDSTLALDDVAFVDVIAGGNGGAISGTATGGRPHALRLTRVSFDEASAQYGGAVAWTGGTVALDDVTFAGCDAVEGGAAQWVDAVVTGSKVTVTGSTAPQGGAFSLRDASFDVEDLSRVRVATDSPSAVGGSIHALRSDVVLTRPLFQSQEALTEGGAIWVSQGSLTLVSPTFTGVVAGTRGGAVFATGAALEVHDAYVSGATAPIGSVLYATGGSVVIEDSFFEDNGGDGKGSAVRIDAPTKAIVDRSTFCANQGTTFASALELLDPPPGTVIRHTAFIANTGANEVVLLGRTTGVTATVEPAPLLLNNTFVLNVAPLASVKSGALVVEVRNTVFQGGAAALLGSGIGGTVRGDYNLYFNTAILGADSNATTSFGANDVFADPKLGLRLTDLCASTLYLRSGSPARDAGDPNLLDVDGTRSDIGRWGGPGSGLPDLDNDTWYADQDCNDVAPTVHPTATETPYDGVDQDCDGADLVDVDRDGFAGGPGDPDCNDLDRRVNPDATEVPYDGVDNDCVGGDLVDVDEDGFDGGPAGVDCNDANDAIHPGAIEIAYDGIDQDCTGGDLVDVDGDGFAGGRPFAPDCDDGDDAIFPGAVEIPYDGIDQDCSGFDAVDLDGDGFPGHALSGGDCDDTNAEIHPGMVEVWYDGIDQDCDGNDADRDLDGFASVDAVTGDGDDCDDLDPRVHPGAEDRLNDDVDQDCDGHLDRSWVQGGGGTGCSTTGPAVWWLWLLALPFLRRRG